MSGWSLCSAEYEGAELRVLGEGCVRRRHARARLRLALGLRLRLRLRGCEAARLRG